MTRLRGLIGCAALLTIVAAACTDDDTRAGPSGGAEVVLRNGVVLTVDESHPRAEAVLIRGERIVAVGDDRDIVGQAGPAARVIDLGGRTVVPGFIDAHSHRLGDFAKVGYPDAAAAIPDTLAQGWTSVHELYVDAARLDALRALDRAGRLPLRVEAYLPVNSFEVTPFDDWYAAYQPGQVVSPHVRVAGLKFFVDYDTGREIRWTQTDLTAAITAAHAKGWQVAAKAIGSATLEMLLNAFERAQGGRADPAWRHRIEHILAVTPAQTDRLRALGVIAVFQTNIPGQLVGERDIEAFIQREPAGSFAPWRSLVEAKVGMAGGTGWPSYYADEPDGPPFASPVRLLYQAVTRTGNHGAQPEPWMLSQTITAEQALRAYTMGSAYASFAEVDRGSITPGKLADLVVLSQNPLAVPTEQLLHTRVLVTMIGGRAQWCAQDAGELCPQVGPAPSTPQAGPDAHLIRPGAPIRLALLAPATGQHAALGQVARNSAALAITDAAAVHGFPVEVSLVDDGCDRARGAAAAQQVIGGGFVAVIGPACSAAATSALPVLEQAGIAMISCAATGSDLAALAPRTFNRTVPHDGQLSAAGTDLSAVESRASVRSLYTRYTAQFGALPPATYRPFIGYCFDAASVLLAAIERTGSVSGDGVLAVDPAALARALRQTAGHAGVTGTVTFGPDGDRAP